MSKHEKGSVMREKYKRHLNHAFERLNNRRDDEAHRISRELVDNHTLLAFEDLDIQKMIDKVEEKCECKQQEHNIHRAFYSVA